MFADYNYYFDSKIQTYVMAIVFKSVEAIFFVQTILLHYLCTGPKNVNLPKLVVYITIILINLISN